MAFGEHSSLPANSLLGYVKTKLFFTSTFLHRIVIAGGDGLLHEVANGLAKRMAAETGDDVNNPHYIPPQFTVPIGMLPFGKYIVLINYGLGKQL